ncbi:hypothetical protein L3Y34_000411 [Caenorhabditis briggsae]|uniref:Uncharacterized protein n=1 Tax=Caenorhabditis briggsae TaxID=6238 RepID=A0AAE9D9B2_CAEBR|nr:hypothetical protein L3Y34_000411 [Caenorhabditis briggsae]
MAWRLKRKCIIISILVLFAFLLFLAEISSDFRPPFKNPRPLFDFNETAFLPELNLSDSCFQWLLELGATPIPALLIDRHVLKQLKRGKCDNVDVINTVKNIPKNSSEKPHRAYSNPEFFGILESFEICGVQEYDDETGLKAIREISIFTKIYSKRSGNSEFRVNDSYEITVVPKSGFPTPIDIFLLYETKNETTGVDYRWVGGTAVDGTKYKYIYPPYDPYCSADLLGHIFWVTCTPEDKVTLEYGNQWYLDRNSLKYVWNAAKNVIKNGRFSRRQMMETVYNVYKYSDYL